MATRQPIKKSVRFEVFKRDKFTCQYCGGKAPDVVLVADHINPVAEGGESDILNLVTACQPCNAGKGAKALSNNAALEKQRDQLEQLQERREQIEMMMAWREELAAASGEEINLVSGHISRIGGWVPNKNGRSDIKRWMKKYSIQEILDAADEAFDQYLRFTNDQATSESWNYAFKKIPAIMSLRRQAVDKPYLPKLLYIQGILRNRCCDRWMRCVDALEEMVMEGVGVETLELQAKRADTWEQFCVLVVDWQAKNGRGE